MGRLPDSESVVFCILCPLFGPAFYSSGLCNRPRFLVSLALWLFLVFGVAAMIIRFDRFHPREVFVPPGSENHFNASTITAGYWCSGVAVSLMKNSLRSEGTLAFSAFVSETIPPVNMSNRLIYGLNRSISAPGEWLAFSLKLPMTPGSRLNVNVQSPNSLFRLTVLEGQENIDCWLNNVPDPPPDSCAIVNFLPTPTNLSIEVDRETEVAVAVTSVTGSSEKGRGTVELSWNVSEYQRPPLLTHASDVCRRSASFAVGKTKSCTFYFDVDGESRRQLLVQIEGVNETSVMLNTVCIPNVGSYVAIFIAIPMALWILMFGLLIVEKIFWGRLCRKKNYEDVEDGSTLVEGDGSTNRYGTISEVVGTSEGDTRESNFILRTLRRSQKRRDQSTETRQ